MFIVRGMSLQGPEPDSPCFILKTEQDLAAELVNFHLVMTTHSGTETLQKPPAEDKTEVNPSDDIWKAARERHMSKVKTIHDLERDQKPPMDGNSPQNGTQAPNRSYNRNVVEQNGGQINGDVDEPEKSQQIPQGPREYNENKATGNGRQVNGNAYGATARGFFPAPNTGAADKKAPPERKG